MWGEVRGVRRLPRKGLRITFSVELFSVELFPPDGDSRPKDCYIVFYADLSVTFVLKKQRLGDVYGRSSPQSEDRQENSQKIAGACMHPFTQVTCFGCGIDSMRQQPGLSWETGNNWRDFLFEEEYVPH